MGTRDKYQLQTGNIVDRLPENAAGRVVYARKTQNVIPRYTSEMMLVAIAGAGAAIAGWAIGRVFPVFQPEKFEIALSLGINVAGALSALFGGTTIVLASLWRFWAHDQRSLAHETELEFSDPNAPAGGGLMRIYEIHSDKHQTTGPPIEPAVVEGLARLVWERGERALSQRALERAKICSRNNDKKRNEIVDKLTALDGWVDSNEELTDGAALRLYWLLDEASRKRNQNRYIALTRKAGEDVEVIEKEGRDMADYAAAMSEGNGEN